tara:strand:+ start:1759 stop:2043 length:285 start_codon:yes stop_codon:yes gene_type:complete
MNKPSWLKHSIATKRGYETKSGELLKSSRLTQEQIDIWNVVEEEEAPVVVEEAPSINLKSKSKSELITIAESLGLEVNPKDKKADIIYILETLV